MLESRSTYGWGHDTTRPKSDLKKWQVAYRTKDGGFGIVGYVCLFTKKSDAEAFGERFKAEHDYVSEVIIQHPSRMVSGY